MTSVVQMPFEASSSLRPKPEELHWGVGRNLWPISVLFCSPGLALALPNPSPPPPPQMDSRTSELQDGQRRTSKCANPSFLFLGWRPGFVCSKALPKRGQFELTPLSLGGTGRLAPGVELCSQLRSLPVWQGQTGPSNAKPLFEGTFSKPNLLGTLGGRFLLDKSNAAKFGLQFGARSGAYHDQTHWRLFPQVSAELGTHRWRATGTYASPNTCFSPSARSADPPKDEWIAGDLSLGMEVLTGRRSRIGLVGFRVQEAGPVRLEVLGPQHLARFSKPFGVEAEWAFGLTKGLSGLIQAGTESLFGPMAASKGTSGWMERLYIRFGLEWIWRLAAGKQIGRSLWAHSPGLLSREVWSYAQELDPSELDPPTWLEVEPHEALYRQPIEEHPELNVMETSLGLSASSSLYYAPEGEAFAPQAASQGLIGLSSAGLQFGSGCQVTNQGLRISDPSQPENGFQVGPEGLQYLKNGQAIFSLHPDQGVYLRSGEQGLLLSAEELAMGPSDLEVLKSSAPVRLSSRAFDAQSGKGYLVIQGQLDGESAMQLLTPKRYELKTPNGQASLAAVQRGLPEFSGEVPDVPELNFTLSNRDQDSRFTVAVSNPLEESYQARESQIRTDRLEFIDEKHNLFFGIGLNSPHLYRSCPKQEDSAEHYGSSSDPSLNGVADFTGAGCDTPYLLWKSSHPETKGENINEKQPESQRNLLFISAEQIANQQQGLKPVMSYNLRKGTVSFV